MRDRSDRRQCINLRTASGSAYTRAYETDGRELNVMAG